MGKRETVTEQPRYIKLDTPTTSRSSSTVSACRPARASPAALSFAIVPQGHKIALVDIAEGTPILRYGEVIGYAVSPIRAGEWVEKRASACRRALA